MFALFKKPALLTVSNKRLAHLQSLLTDGKNITVETITTLPNNRIQIQLTYESAFGFFAGAGLRISLDVKNVVLLLCKGVEQYDHGSNIQSFHISFENGKSKRSVKCLLPNGEARKITCKKIIIVSHERYCCDDSGINTPLESVLEQYKGSGMKLRELLNELKDKRNREKKQNIKA